jgi:hypothetical protein
MDVVCHQRVASFLRVLWLDRCGRKSRDNDGAGKVAQMVVHILGKDWQEGLWFGMEKLLVRQCSSGVAKDWQSSEL